MNISPLNCAPEVYKIRAVFGDWDDVYSILQSNRVTFFRSTKRLTTACLSCIDNTSSRQEAASCSAPVKSEAKCGAMEQAFVPRMVQDRPLCRNLQA